jgi:hypothetical protein
MAKVTTVSVCVKEIWTLTNSRDGGKAFRIVWDHGTARTKPNAQVAYLVSTDRLGWYEIDLDSRNQIIGMRKL